MQIVDVNEPHTGQRARHRDPWPWVLAALLGVVLWNAYERVPSALAPAQSSERSSGNPAHDRLMKATEEERLQLFTHAAGGACTNVTKRFFAGLAGSRRRPTAYWNIRCVDGRGFEVMVTPDRRGSTKIQDCDVLRRVANFHCFQRLQDQSGARRRRVR